MNLLELLQNKLIDLVSWILGEDQIPEPRKAQYICIEGTEGVGKTTQTNKLIEHLKSSGHSVLETKEPGTPHVPLTQELRKFMLDNKHDQVMTIPAREYVSQSIRSIHLERLIAPALKQYDYIIQDRGILSGIAYGEACNNPIFMLKLFANYVVNKAGLGCFYKDLYDHVIILRGNPEAGLSRAKSAKQEFETGDAMESRGNSFMHKVEANFKKYEKDFKKVTVIHVEGKSIGEVFSEIQKALEV